MLISETGAPGWAEVVIEDLPPRGGRDYAELARMATAAGVPVVADERTVRVLIKVGESGGRWVIVTLIVNGEVVSPAVLRVIPLARIETMLNTGGIGARIASPQAWRPPAAQFRRVSWAAEFGQLDDGLAAYLRSATPHHLTDGVQPSAGREPLRRPDGSDPERFYRLVADAYSTVVAETSRPAKVLADEAGVPVATVHRWILEARRRGFLPPARKGRAG